MAIDHDEVEAFLAHHGVKGMKWGVRRTDAQLGNPDGGSNGVHTKTGVEVTKSKMAATPAASVKLTRRQKKQLAKAGVDVKTIDVKKKEDLQIDNPHDIKLSEDARRYVMTRLKESHEMSDAEIKQAIQRKDQVDKYNALFNPTEADLAKQKFETLDYQMRAAQLQAQLNPSKVDRALAAIDKGKTVYNSMPGPLRDLMSKQMKSMVDEAIKTTQTRQERRNSPKSPSLPKPKLGRRSKRGKTPGPSSSKSDQVFNITDVGGKDPFHDPTHPNPFIPQLTARHSAVDELFANHGVNFSEVTSD